MHSIQAKDALTSDSAQWIPGFDVATALWIGNRERQEDALVAEFDDDSNVGFLVLSDGMGGHASGEFASALVTKEVFGELQQNAQSLLAFENLLPKFLAAAVTNTNARIKSAINGSRRYRGMGATLVAPVFVEDRLYWVSVGDSPFYRLRDGVLTQLNEDHSMAAEIDLLVEKGMIAAEQGRKHPARNCLKSAVAGEPIKKIDCPETPETVLPGDAYILASDGLQSLSDKDICELVQASIDEAPDLIADTLMQGVRQVGDPNQDNVSIAVIKILA